MARRVDRKRGVGIYSNMAARLLLRERRVLGEDRFAEMVTWRLSDPLPRSAHGFKSRLAFVVNEVCVLRFDNETGKGDHKHIGDREVPYAFIWARATGDGLLERDRQLEVCMSTVTLGISSVEHTKARMRRAFHGEKQGAFISFASAELLWKVITPKRWQVLRAMTGAGPIAIREVARRVERDVKAVHGDVQALLKVGVIDRTTNGQIVFPYDEVHVDFVLRAA
jgi:predicted transcriptional regulator